MRQLKAYVERREVRLLDEAVVLSDEAGRVAQFFPDAERMEFARGA